VKIQGLRVQGAEDASPVLNGSKIKSLRARRESTPCFWNQSIPNDYADTEEGGLRSDLDPLH